MKKSLVALAALAVAGVASAQSSVTLFGIVDANIQGVSTSYETPVGGGGPKATRWGVGNSGLSSSQLGFRGTEDLGGGLAASFWLEAGLANDTGAAGSTAATTGLFNRRSTVSLSGGFGELRIGRDYKPTFYNNSAFDPFGTNGVGTNVLQNIAGVALGTGLNFDSDNVRHSNTVGYFLPSNLGGFYGQVMYGFAEKTQYSDPPVPLTTGGAPTDTRSGDYLGGRVGYANGPLNVAAAYGVGRVASDYYAGRDDTNSVWNIGASWDFGFLKLFGEYGSYEVERKFDPAYLPSTKVGAEGALLGVTVPVGPGLIRAAYSYAKVKDVIVPGYNSEPEAQKFALGYVHNLSKRTALYATFAYVDNKDGLPLGVNGSDTLTGFRPNNSYGYDFGIRHSF